MAHVLPIGEEGLLRVLYHFHCPKTCSRIEDPFLTLILSIWLLMRTWPWNCAEPNSTSGTPHYLNSWNIKTTRDRSCVDIFEMYKGVGGERTWSESAFETWTKAGASPGRSPPSCLLSIVLHGSFPHGTLSLTPSSIHPHYICHSICYISVHVLWLCKYNCRWAVFLIQLTCVRYSIFNLFQ